MLPNSASRSALQERLDFIGLDREARNRLKAMKPLIARSIGPALDAFYQKVRANPETRAFFRDDGHVSGAKSRQASHWGIIADAEFDEEYLKNVRAVGHAHARLGLEPRLYIGGYALIAEQLIAAIVAEGRTGLFGRPAKRDDLTGSLSSLMKAIFVDMDLAISIYLEEIDAQRRKAEEARAEAARNQQAALDALTAALQRLASGDLRTRLTVEVAAEFQQLKDDFNKATTELERAIARVAEASAAIGDSTSEIGQAADDMSRRTEQQAASIEESAAALNELASAAKTSNIAAAETATKVMTTRKEAESSGDIVRSAVAAMNKIEKSSSEIGQIIGVIDEIAFQTNLLALNAGVEAARAGEAGRGFAVVAQEVRSLAQRSAEAAKEIKSLITASTEQVMTGVKLIGETGAVSEKIIAQVTEIDDGVARLASSANEQTTGLAEVTVAINQMDTTTQQNAAMVEQTAAAVQSLRNQAEELLRTVRQFKIHDAPSSSGERRERIERRAARPAPATHGNAALAMDDSDGWSEF